MAIRVCKKDSTEIIQQKLDQGGTIIFDTGTYNIHGQLLIGADTIINLNGATLRRKGNFQSIFLNRCTTKTTKYKGEGNIHIMNGTFEGMGQYSADNLVTFFHSHDIFISNCKFLDTRCHAIEFNSTKHVMVSNCEFLGCNADEAFREMIQIDAAYTGGFWKSGSSYKSACYDGTCCEDITIYQCLFSKSKDRDYPSACIGTHTQLYGGNTHKDIKILQNRFYCGGRDKDQSCLSLIGMENVQVFSNYFERCGRVARIYTKPYSYKLNGDKVVPKAGDGHSKNITFTDNVAGGSLATSNKCTGIYIDGLDISNVTITNNRFKKSQDQEKYYVYVSKDGCENLSVKDNITDLKFKMAKG